MKERPILFSAPMVRALLAGTKTQTRRVCKPSPVADARFAGGHYFPGKYKGAADLSVKAPYVGLACPYGPAGDRLWVRETFYAWGRWETRFSAKKGRDEWHFIDLTLECGKSYAYAADGLQPQPMGGRRDGGMAPKWWKRPAIHMPRAASRLVLEITGVRVEQLQDISEADAQAEGSGLISGSYSHRGWFRELWGEINGPAAWDANPWVWVVEFRRLP